MFLFDDNDKIFRHLTNSGAFLVAGRVPNVMTISWGMSGVLWGKKVFLLPVRQSRYSKVKLEGSNEFTVSIPFNKFGKELAFCGAHSGKNCDKFHETELVPIKAKKVDTYVVGNCDYYFECVVLTKFVLDAQTTKEVAKFYKDNDYHTLYIAEIVSEYVK